MSSPLRRTAVRTVVPSALIAAWLAANLVAWRSLRDAEFLEAYGVPAAVHDRFEQLPAGEAGAAASGIPLRLYVPASVDPRRPLPLIVYLHGSGDRGVDGVRPLRGLPSVLADRSSDGPFPFFILVPQCPPGRIWPLFDEGERRPDPLARAIFTAVDRVCAERPVDRRRVHLVGYSMGGRGACELAAIEPERFASVVALAGAGGVGLAPRLRETPCLFIHGRRDPVVGFGVSEDLDRALREAGGSSELWPLDGVGHDAWRPEHTDYRRLMSWIQARAAAREKAGRRSSRRREALQTSDRRDG